VTAPDRALVVLAAVAGFCGVALSAAAAHAPAGPTLDTAARFLLVHAAVLIGLAALLGQGALRPIPGRLAAWLIVVGLCLFCGDLSMRAFRSSALFPLAAPAGGFALMSGWLVVAVAALARRTG